MILKVQTKTETHYKIFFKEESGFVTFGGESWDRYRFGKVKPMILIKPENEST